MSSVISTIGRLFSAAWREWREKPMVLKSASRLRWSTCQTFVVILFSVAPNTRSLFWMSSCWSGTVALHKGGLIILLWKKLEKSFWNGNLRENFLKKTWGKHPNQILSRIFFTKLWRKRLLEELGIFQLRIFLFITINENFYGKKSLYSRKLVLFHTFVALLFSTDTRLHFWGKLMGAFVGLLPDGLAKILQQMRGAWWKWITD